MNRIEWMDLKRQFNIYKDEYYAALHSVCEETAFSGGKYAANFEKEFADFCNVKSASAVNNGTNALFLAMKALGIGNGDEVIVPADTFVATAWGVSYNGATPVFADIDSDTFEIDADDIRKRITSKTKAIAGVHLYGQPFDVDAVKAVAKEYGLLLVEDCAQAHGAQYKDQVVGGLSDAGCFSFYPGKNLGAFGEGGAVTSNSAELIDKINILKNHGCARRYYHDEIGYNMRLEGIQGAVLSCKLKYIAAWNERRREIADMYFKGIVNPKIKMQYQPSWTKSVFHLFVVEVGNRDAFMSHMEDNNIATSIHYPIPCHLQKAYAHLGYNAGDLPRAEYHAEHCVSLPMFPELTDEEVSRVIDACNKY